MGAGQTVSKHIFRKANAFIFEKFLQIPHGHAVALCNTLNTQTAVTKVRNDIVFDGMQLRALSV